MGPLDGIRILELSQGVPGPFATRLLAGFGAHVIKVEPLSGDLGRRLPPLASDGAGGEFSPLFLYLNAGKHSIALDAATAAGATVVCRLAARADAIVTSPDALNPGLDQLREAAPAAVIASVSGIGNTGPDAGRRSNDLMAYARSGWASLTGEPGREPLKGPGHQASFHAGSALVMTILAGLLQRQRDGVGPMADVAMLDALAAIGAPALVQSQFNGHDNTRRRSGFPVGPTPAADGYFVLTTSRAHFWRDAMNELGLPELAQDVRFNDPAARQDLYHEVAPVVEARLAQRPRAELFHRLGLLRVPGGMVVEVDELFDDPQLQAREFFETPPGREAASPNLSMPGQPFVMSRTPWQTPAAAPALGEHTDFVLEAAGYSVAEIAALRESGVVA
ncbi:MAG TPA: CoA transferase [Tepidiformaceae bacterium]|nr:CoA transferase [Tepidiformaceae bacterium]